jgi:hypothetical protein
VIAEELLRRIVQGLEFAGIPYMVTGSYASAHHGRPRATQDLDLVIAPRADQLRVFVRSLSPPSYYVDEETALKALANEDQCTVIEPSSGWKVDLIIRKSRPFSFSEFERRLPVEIQGIRMFVASAEDILLAKLEWAKRGSSERQLEDAAGILQVRGNELDREYLGRWVPTLGLAREWTAACRIAGHDPLQ